MTNFSVGIPQTQGFYERLVLTDWNLSDQKSRLITPQKGRSVVGVSLGWSDRSGGVKLDIPDYPGVLPFDVDPYSPFVGTITVPFKVTVSQPQPLPVDNVESRHTLDLLTWYMLPPCGFPVRGPAFLSETVPPASIGSTLFVRGRKRITVTLHNLAPAAALNNAQVVVGYWVTGGSTLGQEVRVFDVPLVANGTAFYEFDAANYLTEAAVPVNVLSKAPTNVLYVRVRNTSAGSSLGYTIEARDY